MKLEINNDTIVLDGKTYALVETQGPEVELEGKWKSLGDDLYFWFGKKDHDWCQILRSGGLIYFGKCPASLLETLLKDSLKIIQFYSTHGRLPRV